MVKLVTLKKPNGNIIHTTIQDFPLTVELTAKKPDGGNMLKVYELILTDKGLSFRLRRTETIKEGI